MTTSEAIHTSQGGLSAHKEPQAERKRAGKYRIRRSVVYVLNFIGISSQRRKICA